MEKKKEKKKVLSNKSVVITVIQNILIFNIYRLKGLFWKSQAKIIAYYCQHTDYLL